MINTVGVGRVLIAKALSSSQRSAHFN
jgi:hypothetical protein